MLLCLILRTCIILITIKKKTSCAVVHAVAPHSAAALGALPGDAQDDAGVGLGAPSVAGTGEGVGK